MRPTPYVASLRIYEPIDSFSIQDQQHWSQIAISSPTGFDEQKRALTRTISNEPPSLKPDGAHLLDHEGKRYVAPWSTTARCWAALDDFKSTLPPNLIKFFIINVIIKFIPILLIFKYPIEIHKKDLLFGLYLFLIYFTQ